MLHLILGRSASGKTEKIYDLLCNKAVVGDEKLILLVPEQYSFESERHLLHRLGSSASDQIETLSFTRLVDRIGRDVGGISAKKIDDGGRIMIMRQALNAVKSQLSLYGKQSDSIPFAGAMINTMAELKQNAITSSALTAAAATLPISSLQSKLKDISLIYGAYDALLSRQYADQLDDLSKLSEKLKSYQFFKDKTVFIDSFKGFTGQQFKVIEHILSQAKEVYITFCCDKPEEEHEGLGVFSNVKKVIRRIERMAADNKVEIAPPVILENCFLKSEAIIKVEKNLFDDTEDIYKSETDDVNIYTGGTRRDEVDFVARTMRRLAREEHFRYRDMAIIARDLSLYQDVLQTAMERYDIPLFMDTRSTVATLPLMVFILSAFDIIVGGYKSADILRFAKTGLTGISEGQLSAFENYIYIWSINGRTFHEPFTMEPGGFRDNIRSDTDKIRDDLELGRLNKIRQTLIGPLIKLGNSFGSVKDTATAIYKFINEYEVTKHLSAYADTLGADGRFEYADLQRRSYDMLMKILNQLTITHKDVQLPLTGISELLKTVISLQDLGEISQKMDQAAAGSADRMRPGRPRAVFILGANQSEFPARTEEGGIFSTADRMRLKALGMELPDHHIEDSVEENFLVYSTVCSASEKLYLTCHRVDEKGKPAGPSSLLSRILKAVPFCNRIKDNSDMITLDKLEAPLPSLERLALFYHEEDEIVISLKEYFKQDEDYNSILSSIESADTSVNTQLNRDVAGRLYGKSIYLSATRIDTYFHCPFSFFCRYGIKANPVRPAELDVMQRGTIVHYVLEMMINRYGKLLASIQADEQREAVKGFMNQYINDALGGKELKTKRFLYLLDRIELMLSELIAHMSEEFAVSDFETVSCELKIGKGEDIEPLTVELADGGEVSVSGSVDRVDIWEHNGKKYVRVVDYKTGSKTFQMADILYGLNLQMLIYLSAIVKNGSTFFNGEIEAAGILYMPSRNDFIDETAADGSPNKKLRMNGVLLRDNDVIRAMERDGQGIFIPASFKKDGELHGSSSVIDHDDFTAIDNHIGRVLADMGDSLHNGDVGVKPFDGRESEACKYCDYRSVCKREPVKKNKRVESTSKSDVLLKLKEADANGVQTNQRSE